MGINGLLPFLKEATIEKNISEYAGMKIAVDGYCILYGGAYSCPVEICLEISIAKMIKYFKSIIQLLLDASVTPIVVFDGNSLPMKAKTDESRRSQKNENLELGKKLWSEGNKEDARKKFRGAVKVTHEMAKSAMLELDEMKVEYVVAPYEADAQLAHFCLNGIADAVLTQDSDLLVFGCSTVLVKLGTDGFLEEVTWSRVVELEKFNGWNLEMFRMMCILNGCDYLDNIPGVGINYAHKYVQKYKTFDGIFEFLRIKYKEKIPVDYEENFRKSLLTFSYQRVYDHRKDELCTLNRVIDPSLRDYLKNANFIGITEDEATIKGIVKGRIHAKTKEALCPVKYQHDSKPELVAKSQVRKFERKIKSSDQVRFDSNLVGSIRRPKGKRNVNSYHPAISENEPLESKDNVEVKKLIKETDEELNKALKNLSLVEDLNQR